MIPLKVEKDIRKLIRGGLTSSDIAKATGVTRRTVQRLKKEEGLRKRPTDDCSDDLDILDPTGKTIFTPPPWYPDRKHELLLAITSPYLGVSAGHRILGYGESMWSIDGVARKAANTRLIARSPALFCLAMDIHELGRLDIIDSVLFRQLVIRANGILKQIRGTV